MQQTNKLELVYHLGFKSTLWSKIEPPFCGSRGSLFTGP